MPRFGPVSRLAVGETEALGSRQMPQSRAVLLTRELTLSQRPIVAGLRRCPPAAHPMGCLCGSS
jgi:hypothetical protein